MFKKILPFFLAISCAYCADPSPNEDYLFFSPAMMATHLKTYTEEEKALIEKDLQVVRSVCLETVSPRSAPVYLATDGGPIYLSTAGGPGARKTTILERFFHDRPEFAQGVYLDPDVRALKLMVHTYIQSIAPYYISYATDYGDLLKRAYTYWRGASNYITLKLLEEAFHDRRTVIHGATSTGDHTPVFYQKLKDAGYEIVLLLCSCDDETRRKAIAYRNEVVAFYQSSPEDAVLKGKIFPQKMVPFFTYADTLYLYWSDDAFVPERLAAVFEKGKFAVKDQDAFNQFVQKYDSDRTELAMEGKHLLPFHELINIYTTRLF